MAIFGECNELNDSDFGLRIGDFLDSRTTVSSVKDVVDGVLNDPDQLRRKMDDFLLSKPDSMARFDDYMTEHLFNERNGYYSRRATINSPGGHFATSPCLPSFSRLIHARLSECGLAQGTMVEVGGGSGTFKSRYRGQFADGKFISVERSDKLSKLQAEYDDGDSVTVRGSASSLPFRADSIEGCIFANELLDALSCRVFQVDIGQDGRYNISGEVFVGGKDNLFNLKKIESGDRFVALYEAYLNETPQTDKLGKETRFVSVSPDFEKTLREMLRVLKKGKIILPDYGFHDGEGEERIACPVYNVETRIHKEDPRLTLEKTIEKPYETDITYNVDFQFCEWLVRKIDPTVEVKFTRQTDYFSDLLLRHPESEEEARLNGTGFLFERFGKHFCVLEVTKN